MILTLFDFTQYSAIFWSFKFLMSCLICVGDIIVCLVFYLEPQNHNLGKSYKKEAFVRSLVLRFANMNKINMLLVIRELTLLLNDFVLNMP